MSRTAAGAALTAEHRRQQLALRAVTTRDLLTLWPVWDPNNRATWERFLILAMTLVRLRNGQSAGLAAGYYRRFREAEGITGGPTVVLAEAPNDAQMIAALTATGLAGTYRAIGRGFSLPAALQSGFVQAAGSAGRLVLGGGRETVVQSAGADPRSGKWARVTSGSPCQFCSMLEGRGAVYTENTADFEAHDHCACSAEPEF